MSFESDVELFLHLRKGKHGMLSPHFNYLIKTHLPIIVECVLYSYKIRENRQISMLTMIPLRLIMGPFAFLLW